MTAALVEALASHRAPAVAFVNESKLYVDDETAARKDLLRRWADSSAILGNHTFSHAGFNTRTPEQFADEIAKGDAVSRRLMQPYKPYQLFFRHPMTHAGDTAAKKEAAEQFLALGGYKIAPHAIDSSDFIFNVAFVRARESAYEHRAARIGDAYLNFVMSAKAFAEPISRTAFGRPIPQTMLLHANDINAAYLDQLLTKLERLGYRFVTIESTLADAAYQTRDTFVTKAGARHGCGGG